jgi:hypothetical protein
MVWPQFDGATAINQFVEALYTLAGVAAGGGLAFWLGARQLRKERALDRRVVWTEELLGALAEYKATMDLLVPAYEEAIKTGKPERVVTLVGSAQEQGRALRRLLARAEFYGTAEERASAETLAVHEIAANSAFYGILISEEAEQQGLKQLRETLSALEPHRRDLVKRLRAELGLERAVRRGDEPS